MRGYIAIFFICIFSQLTSSEKVLEKATSEAVAGTTILLADGIYKDIKLILKANGEKEKPIIIQAENPGRTFFSSNVKIELRENHNILNGIYFKNGGRNIKEWKSHGPGLVAIYADYCEVSECLFHQFDDANSAYITTSIDEDGHIPQYCHIHHCAFIEKTTLDQVFNLNNTLSKCIEGKPADPMYHRVSYCYFSNPPKKGNAGGSIRIGYWRKDYGELLITTCLKDKILNLKL